MPVFIFFHIKYCDTSSVFSQMNEMLLFFFCFFLSCDTYLETKADGGDDAKGRGPGAQPTPRSRFKCHLELIVVTAMKYNYFNQERVFYQRKIDIKMETECSV